MLHDIEERRVYCGPSVLIALTGKRLPEIRAIINRVRKRRENIGICGMNRFEMADALTMLGYQYADINAANRPTLLHWFGGVDENKRYIVRITDHYVITYNRTIIDNRIRFGCDAEDHPCTRKHVKSYFAID